MNLQQLGIDLPASPDTLLVAGEKPGWTSDKSSRRALIAQSYRILLQCGDDFGDFLAGANNTPQRRLELADAHRDWWGRRWFLLPNPLTGSWTSAAVRSAAAATGAQSLDRRSILKGYDSMPRLTAQ